MAKLTVQKIENKIFSLLTTKKSGYPSKELRLKLGISKNTKILFRKALNNLIMKEKIYKTKGGKRYIILSKSQKVTGELRISRSGFGFVHNEERNNDIFISKDHLNTAFDRDIVEVKLYARFRGKNEEGFVNNIVKRFRNKFVGTFHQTPYWWTFLYREVLSHGSGCPRRESGVGFLL